MSRVIIAGSERSLQDFKLDVIELRLHMPRQGVWHALLSVDSPDEVTTMPLGVKISILGEVSETVAVHQLDVFGRVRSQGISFGTMMLDVVGGQPKGDLSAAAPVKNYQSTTAGAVLNDLLSAAKEKASGSISSSFKNTQLERWSTSGGRTIGAELDALVKAAVQKDGAWRVLDDGTVWAGQERWPGVDPEYEVTQNFPFDRTLQVVQDVSKLLLPGQSLKSWATGKLSYVMHEQLGGKMKSTLFGEDA